MPQSLCKIYLHIIYHIKTTSPIIREEDLERVHAYIGELVNKASCVSIIVGGVGDHVHILCMLGRTISVADILEDVKRNSSRWIKTISPYYTHFEWQGGYAALSLGESGIDNAIHYIKRQKEHHSRTSFEEEYKQLLALYNVEYDPRYYMKD